MGKEMKQKKSWKKKEKLGVLLIAILLLMVVQLLNSDKVYAETATGYKVTYKGAVSSMGSTCGKFTIKGRDAFCAEHPKATPPTGTKITSTKLLTNSTMRKALYYGYGGPKAKVSKNNAGWVSTSIALSRANGKGGGTTKAQKFYKKLGDYSTPPDSFKVYICNTAGGLQDLCYWIYEPEGKLRVKKQSTDANATSSRGYSLSGAVYGVYKNKSCASDSRVTKLTTGSSGISGKATLDKGTYYIKEMTAPKGFSLSSTVYTVSITDQCDKTVTVKDAPKKGKIQLVKSSDNPDVTKNNSAYSLSGAEYGVWSDSARTKKVGTLKTTSSGKSNILSVWAGTYYIKETVAPKGYKKDPSVYKLSVSVTSIGTTKILKVKDVPKKGKLQLVKSSSDPGLTDSNSAYSLSGAKYGVWSDSSLKKKVGTLTTKSDGSSNVISVYPGIYYVKETTAPKGYMKDNTIHKVTVTGSNFTTTKVVKVKDVPESDPAWVIIQKIDAESGEAVSDGDYDMSGAEFKVKYYEGTDWDEDPAEAGIEAKREWVFRTNESGYICLDDNEYFVSGDDLYYNDLGNPTIPIGTITLQEAKAPEGYEINNEVFIVKILIDDNKPGVSLNQIPTTIVEEQPIKGDIEIIKKDSKTGKLLEGVVFYVIDAVSNEVAATIVTDENGYATTTAVGESNGSLSYGEYIVREESAPAGYLPMSEDIRVVISQNKEKICLNIENTPAEIGTSATFKENGLRIINVHETVTIIDEVYFKNLIPGQGYRLEGVLMDTFTGEPLKLNGEEVTSSMSFVPESAAGSLKMEFVLNGEALAGKSVTVFEELYIEETMIASHKDITDKEQTVTFLGPSEIGTTAYFKDNNSKEILPTETVTIVDEVRYKNLIPGNEYKLSGVLMDTETGEPLLVDENKVISDIEFVPETSVGVVYMEFILDASRLSGKSVTVFENLYTGGILVASHKELTDEGQTVSFIAMGDIEIYKGDEMTGKPLEGVKFQIIDKLNGEVVAELVTDDLGYATTACEEKVGGSLLLGEYIIKETEPLPGYAPIEDMEVMLDDFNRIMSVKIDNMPLPVPEEEIADTGDPMGRVIPLSIVLLIISFMGALVSVRRKGG